MCAKMLPRPNFLLTPAPTPSFPDSPSNFTNKFPKSNKFYKPRDFSRNNGEVKCNHPGCNFMASPDVLVLHQKVSHFKLHTKNAGLVVDSPEEIAKWREERRSRFPKLGSSNLPSRRDSHYHQNYANKRQFNNYNNNNNNNRFQFSNSRKRSFNDYNRSYNNRNNHQFHKKLCNVQQINSQHKPPSPISKKDQIVISDRVASSKISTNNSLNLLAGYESSDEEDVVLESSATKTESNPSSTGRDFYPKSDPVLEQTISNLVSDLVRKVELNEKKGENARKLKENSKPRRRPFIVNKYLSYSKLTLFQKLMLQDVRQVKEDFMQCLRYIKDNNYLENV